MAAVNSFDVMKEMSRRNGKIQLAPLSNIEHAAYSKKVKGTRITIGIAGNVVTGILTGDYVGGLILCDKDEFNRIKAEMEAGG